VRRREFISLLGSAATAWPLAAPAQQAGKAHRLAILTQSEPVDRETGARQRIWTAFFEELRRLGHEEGRTLAVEWRSSAGDAKHRSELAAQVVALKPDAVFTPDVEMARALKAATSAIPIVTIAGQPVALGLAASLARPGGNVTGFSVDAGAGLAGKRIGLLKEAVPSASRMAWLAPARTWESSTFRGTVHEAARIAGMTVIRAVLDSPADDAAYRRVFAAMVRDGADSIYVGPNLEHVTNRRLIAALALEARLPAIYVYRENVEVGGLMAYAVNLVEIFRGAAGYIDRVLKGSNPATMPFQQQAKFELIVNLKTAKALGLAIPEPFLARADEVIE
jgi:putative ABC transport system substrate-binding protein